jgi:hypothetical protein
MSSDDEKPDPTDADAQVKALMTGPFLTGVEIDVDQWRAQTIEELQTWLNDIRTRKTKMGDNLVDFPQDWDAEKIVSQKEQLDIISKGLSESLTGQEAKEAQTELQVIRAQADKLRKLDRILGQLGNDDDMELDAPVDPVDEDLLEQEIVIPRIDTNAPNPFDLDEATLARLKQIDEKLGIISGEEEEVPLRSLNEINDDLLKIYQSDQKEPTEEAAATQPDKQTTTEKPSDPVKGVRPLNRKK